MTLLNDLFNDGFAFYEVGGDIDVFAGSDMTDEEHEAFVKGYYFAAGWEAAADHLEDSNPAEPGTYQSKAWLDGYAEWHR